MIGHLLTQTVTYAPVSGRSNGGQPTFGAQVAVACRWEHGSTKTSGPDGIERIGSNECVTEVEIPTNARVWGPDDDTTKNNEGRMILGRDKMATPDGRTLYRIVL